MNGSIATVTGLWRYPLKSGRAQPLDEARVLATGIEADREWMIADASGRFLSQREEPRLALLDAAAVDGCLRLSIPGHGRLDARVDPSLPPTRARVWDDDMQAHDAGDGVAGVLGAWLGRPARLLRFDPSRPRPCDPRWTGEQAASTAFADGFPLLLAGEASLAELNARLERPLPMERFRPNLVISGLPPYAEDDIEELRAGPLVLRPIKPCTRCIITTTDQASGARDGDEPLRTLRGYRYDASLRGVCFGQNVIVAAGAGTPLRRGQQLEVTWRKAALAG